MDQPITYKSFNRLRPALFAALAAAALLVAACGDRAAEPEVVPAEQAASPQTVPAGAVVTVPVTVYVTVPVTIPVPVTVEAAAPVVEPAPATAAPAIAPDADTGTTPITTAPAATAPVTASAPVTLSAPATTSAAATSTAAVAGTPTVAPTRTPLPPATERPTGAFAAWWEGDPALQEALGLARSVEPAAVQLAYQPFERGLMVWRADDQRIYALLADGTWESYDDSFREGDVERDGSISAPGQLLQPVRGFGKIWRDDRTLQSRIGWGTDEESPAQGVIQLFDNGFILRINARTFAIYDAGNGNRWTERPS